MYIYLFSSLYQFKVTCRRALHTQFFKVYIYIAFYYNDFQVHINKMQRDSDREPTI